MVAPESALDEAEQSPLQVGQVLVGKYRVERQIGRGGMGVVLAATHLQLEHQVAIKVLRRDLLEDDKALARLLSEARAAAKIRSEHVARVLDVGTLDNGCPFIVMEYLEGEDLADLLDRRGALEASQAVQFLLQSCEALAEVHAAEMVHRDLKPGNLFIARLPDGSPSLKIVDFGISKHIGNSAQSARSQAATTSAQVLGSPYYMPPEQMRAEPVDERSDIWSLGAILFEMLTARPPFLGDTLPEVYAAVLAQPAPRVASLRPDVPPGLDEIVQRCLDKEPAQRFADVAELAEALAPFGTAMSAQSVERVSRILNNPQLFRTPAASLPAASSPSAHLPKPAGAVEPSAVGTARGGIALEPALAAAPVVDVGAASVLSPALVTPALAAQARRTSSSEFGPLSATGSHSDLPGASGSRGLRLALGGLGAVLLALVAVLALRQRPEPLGQPEVITPLAAANGPRGEPADGAGEATTAPPDPQPAAVPAPAAAEAAPKLQIRAQALKPAPVEPPRVTVQGDRSSVAAEGEPPAEKTPRTSQRGRVPKRARPRSSAAKPAAVAGSARAKSQPRARSETPARAAAPAPAAPPRTKGGSAVSDPWNPSSFGDRR